MPSYAEHQLASDFDMAKRLSKSIRVKMREERPEGHMKPRYCPLNGRARRTA